MLKKFILGCLALILLTPLLATKVGYAISGGGARGFAHIGMLKVLEENGIHPDYISGTSIGAYIGALYAMGYNAAQIESLTTIIDWNEIFSDKWKREELYIGQKRWAPIGNAFFRMDSSWSPQLPQAVLIGNRINLQLFKLFASASPVVNFSHFPIPFSCVATDLVTGQLTEFSSGSLMQGVRASMSVPSVLQPFPLKDKLYIDGGISQNLPGKQVKAMGADFVIGLKVNSTLKQPNQLQGIIQILDQTINIGMTTRVNDELAYCDYILNPDLSDYSTTDFSDIRDIIAIGEQYARDHIDEIKVLATKLDGIPHQNKVIQPIAPLKTVSFNKIVVEGNQNLSDAKVREYLGLNTDTQYSVSTIANRFQQAWNSQLFDIIYPLLVPDDHSYMLVAVVKERERKYLSLNFSYDNDNEFVAGTVLSLHNFYMRNSHIFAEVKLGGKHELNIDLVKNFGEAYGIYYRLFPYINEKRIYFYDQHDKINSARSLERGITTGIGMYARKSIVVEGYGFSYQNRLYKEIALSDTLEKSIMVSGIGAKLYHESTDDYIFPMQGIKAMLKASFARKDVMSDETINKILADVSLYRRLANDLSAYMGLQYGSHFKESFQSNFDPFYLGGIDCFTGFARYEKSAPFYKLFQIGLVLSPYKNIFVSTKFQALNYADNDIWDSNHSYIMGGVAELGISTVIGPVRLVSAIAEDSPVKLFINVGFTNDMFHFSRR
jgi:predicted acylesterase/phospholipase RssA